LVGHQAIYLDIMNCPIKLLEVCKFFNRLIPNQFEFAPSIMKVDGKNGKEHSNFNIPLSKQIFHPSFLLVGFVYIYCSECRQ
jgi:hypothetical protein